MAREFKDLVGEVFGSWTVLARDLASVERARWLCRCSCGAECSVLGFTLTGGKSVRCRSCARRAQAAEPAEKARKTAANLAGQTFGSWTVLARVPHVPGEKGARWLCRCSCGAEHVVTGPIKTRSCRPCAARANRALGRERAELDAVYGDAWREVAE